MKETRQKNTNDVYMRKMPYIFWQICSTLTVCVHEHLANAVVLEHLLRNLNTAYKYNLFGSSYFKTSKNGKI